MGKTVKLRNSRNGVEQDMPEAQWNKIKDTKLWRGVFSVSEQPEKPAEPKEVKELKERKAKPEKATEAKKQENKEN